MRAISRLAPQGYLASFISLLKVSALVLFSYLLQVSAVPYLKVADVMPNLMMICIAVLTVSKGKKYAFSSGAVFGILLESMASNLRLFNLLMYPSLALLCAQLFADMSELKRELLRIRIAQRQADRGTIHIAAPHRRRRLRQLFRRTTADDLNPHLRTLLNALMLVFLYEAIMIAYIALEGVRPTWGHLGRVMRTLMYTAVASVLMFPARAFLNMYRPRRRATSEDGGEEVSITEKDLRQITLEPDMPEIRGVEPVAAPPSQPTMARAAMADDEQQGRETSDEASAPEAKEPLTPSAEATPHTTETTKEPQAQPLQEDENREN